MQFGFGAPVSGPLSGPRDLARIVSEGEAMGYDYCTIQRPCRDPARHGGEIPLFRYRRVPRPGRRRPARAADRGRVCRRQDLEIAPRHLGDRRAAPPAGVDRQDPRDDRRAVGGPASPGASASAGARRSSRRSAPSLSRSAAPSPTRRSPSAASCGPRKTRASSGKYAKFSNIFFQPRPVQKRVPIWVGGESGPAMRRTARLGDAWYPIGTNPQQPARHDEALPGRHRAAAQALTREAGRDPSKIGLAYRFTQFGQGDPGARR